MLRRLWLALLFLTFASAAWAQGCGSTNPNCIVPTRPAGDSTNAAANTAWVSSSIFSYFQTQALTVTGTNTLSALSQSFTGVSAALVVNGVTYTTFDTTPAFNISGTTVTWNAGNAGFNLTVGDNVVLSYTSLLIPGVSFGAGVQNALAQPVTGSGGIALATNPTFVNINISPTANSTTKGFNINQSAPVSGTLSVDTVLNSIIVSQDDVDINNYVLFGEHHIYDFGGANIRGARVGYSMTMNMSGTSTNSPDANPYYTGIIADMEIAGHSATPLSEQIDGINSFVNLSDTTKINALFGFESDVIMQAGTSAIARGGYVAVAYNGTQATTSDAAYIAAAIGGGAAAPWKVGLLFTNFSTGAPVDPTGCLICTDGSSDTVATGFDTGSYTITGNLIHSANAWITGAGQFVGTSYVSNSASLGTQSAITFELAFTPKWQIGLQTDASFFLFDNNNSATVMAVTTGGLTTIGEATKTLTLNSATLVAPNITTGTPNASVCMDASNHIIKKTTAGSCV